MLIGCNYENKHELQTLDDDHIRGGSVQCDVDKLF
jgi:hypothetical protein